MGKLFKVPGGEYLVDSEDYEIRKDEFGRPILCPLNQGGGGDQPKLYAPEIKITGDTLTIIPNTDNGAFVTGYNGYMSVDGGDFELYGTLPSDQLELDLTAVGLPEGDFQFKATAIGTNFQESDASNVEDYTNIFYTVANTLTNCTSNNSATSARKGSAYTATLTAEAGYTMNGATVTVTMGGADITSTAYANGVITIAQLAGDLVVVASAAESTTLEFIANADYPFDNGIYSMAYGDGEYVALTTYESTTLKNRYFSTSSDGLTWGESTTIPGTDLYKYGFRSRNSIIFGNGKFVALATQDEFGIGTEIYAIIRQNGEWSITLTNITTSDIVPSTSLQFENGKFITTDDNNKIAMSEDGLTWNVFTINVDGLNRIRLSYGVYWFNGSYCFAGYNSAATTAPYIVKTTDFSTYTKSLMGNFTIGNFYATENIVIAWDRNNSILYKSTDGENFESISAVFGDESYANILAKSSNRFIVLVPDEYSNSVVAYSQDGAVWKQTNLPLTKASKLYFCNDKFIATYYNKNAYALS